MIIKENDKYENMKENVKKCKQKTRNYETE